MRPGGANPERLNLPRLRRWLAIGVFAVLAAGVALAEPPPESMASKYPPRKAEDAKLAPASEPDPRDHGCPPTWLERIFDDEEVANDVVNSDEYHAYNYLVDVARKYTPEQFAKVTRKELTWRVLFSKDRAKYRGEIARVEGRLKRLVWIGANKELENEGVKNLYEAWIFEPDKYFSNPTCVIISELPPGLEPSEDYKDTVHIVCDGYFFKRYKYRAVNDTRLAPLVIGHTLTVVPPEVVPDDPGAAAFGRYFLPVALGLGLGMVALAWGLHRWYGREDQRTYRRLETARYGEEFVAPVEKPTEPPREHESELFDDRS